MTSVALGYIMPILAYLFIFTLVYALLAKTKILGSNNFIHFVLSLVIAISFVLTPMSSQFTVLTIPWVAIFILMVFFILLIITFMRGNIDDIVNSNVIAVIVAIVILLIFIVSAMNVFGPLVSQGSYLSSEGQSAFSFFANPQFVGLVVLLILAAIISWQMTKKD